MESVYFQMVVSDDESYGSGQFCGVSISGEGVFIRLSFFFWKPQNKTQPNPTRYKNEVQI